MVLNFSMGSDWELVIFCGPDWKHSSHLTPDELAQPLLSLQLRRRRTQQTFIRCSSPAAFGAAPENWQRGDSAIEKLHQNLPSDIQEPPAAFGLTPFAMK